jgi:cytochrome oxidase Cu insertion factor (SCO1/SenC/PrrC family)
MSRIAVGIVVVALVAGGILAAVLSLQSLRKDKKSGDQTASTVHSSRPPNLRPRGTPAPAAPLAVGKEAPELQGTDQDGKPFKLSEYRGKVVLLDFWGNW